MEDPEMTLSSEADLLLHLKTISSFPPTSSPLPAHSTSHRLSEAVTDFLTTADTALRELSITETSLSPPVLDILVQLRNLLISSSRQWDPLRPSLSAPTAVDLFHTPPETALHSLRAAVESLCKKQLLNHRSQELLSSLRQKNNSLSSLFAECAANFEESSKETSARTALLSHDHLETLEYTSDVYQAKAAVLEKEIEVFPKAPEAKQIEEALERHASLRAKKAALEAELAKRSAKGALPPNIRDAKAKLKERQDYLDNLVSQIIEQESKVQDFNLSLTDHIS